MNNFFFKQKCFVTLYISYIFTEKKKKKKKYIYIYNIYVYLTPKNWTVVYIHH